MPLLVSQGPPANCLAALPDGRIVAAGRVGQDKTLLELWDPLEDETASVALEVGVKTLFSELAYINI